MNMGQKAQNLMIALALVTTLLATVAMAYDTDRLHWQLVKFMVHIFGAGAIITIGFCIAVNSPPFYRIHIMEGRLLRSDKLDKKTYINLFKNEEDFYKSLIEEYARDLDKLVATNQRKRWFLTIAYGSFALSVFASIVVVLHAFGLKP